MEIKILNLYYENNGKQLRSLVDSIFYKNYGGTSNKDMDEFYSVANDVFTDIITNHRYDETKGDFNGFLYRALDLAIIDEWKRQRRDKRVQKIWIEVEEDGKKVRKKVPVTCISLDASTDEDSEMELKDIIPSNFDLEKEVLYKDEKYDEKNIGEKMSSYLSHLSKTAKKVLFLISDNYSASEIQRILHISNKEYSNCMAEIHAFRNISILF